MRKTKQSLHFRNKQLQKFLSDKRAVSVALSTLIITATVVAAGISVLYWAYSWGNVANHEYTEAINGNQNATSERIAFEYSTFSAQTLKVYLINCGQVNDIGVARVYIWDSSAHIIGTYPTDSSIVTLMDTAHPGTPVSGNSLDMGKEGYFSIANLQLSSGQYSLRVITERGRSFDTTFNVQ